MRNTGPDLATRQLVIDRLNHACLRCGMPGQVIHHRRPRKRGGTLRPEINSPENLVWICEKCHAWIESRRIDAYASGWLVKEGIDGPAEIPLWDRAGCEFFLTDDGAIVPTGRWMTVRVPR
jgi:hypothetical protein